MTLVKKTFVLFFISFLVQLALLALLMFIGYGNAQNSWIEVRQHQAEELAKAVLMQSSEADQLEYSGQIAIYNEKGELQASSRGMGFRGGMTRNVPSTVRTPVYDQNKLIGYFIIGQETFAQDSANQALIRSMIIVAVAALVLMLGMSALVAWYFSRSISAPADRIAKSLGKIRQGDYTSPLVDTASQELRQIAKAIESLRKSLLDERTLRTQWSHDLAHDLRTPVASIKAQLEALSDHVLQPTAERYEAMSSELKRMEALINDLEELMRLESPETRLQVDEIQSKAFFFSAVQRFEAAALAKGITWEVFAHVESFQADEHLLDRAVANVLSNAVRHAYQDSVIRMGIEQRGDKVELRINNSGPTIPPEDIPRVFERLYRGEYARGSQGSGLGLTIAQRIARLHGGSISIESSEESGTTVRFLL